MTIQQEINLAAKEAFEEGYKKASEEAEKKVQQAAEKEKLENAKKLKESGVSAEIISKCTGLSLEQVREL